MNNTDHSFLLFNTQFSKQGAQTIDISTVSGADMRSAPPSAFEPTLKVPRSILAGIQRV